MAANATLDWNQSLKIVVGSMSNVEDLITNLKTKVFDVGVITKGWRAGGYALTSADSDAYFEIKGPSGGEVQGFRALIAGTAANDSNPAPGNLFAPNAHSGIQNNANQAWLKIALDVPESDGNFDEAGPEFGAWKSAANVYVNGGTAVTPNRPNDESSWIRVFGQPGTAYTPNAFQIVESEEVLAIKAIRTSDGRYTMVIMGAIFKGLANGVFSGPGGGGDPYRIGATGDKMLYGVVSSGSNGSSGAGFVDDQWNRYRQDATGDVPTDFLSGLDASPSGGPGNYQAGQPMVIGWSPVLGGWTRLQRVGGWDPGQRDGSDFGANGSVREVDWAEDGHNNYVDIPITYRHYTEVTYFGELRQMRIGSPGFDGAAFATTGAAAQQFRAGPGETLSGCSLIFSPNP